MRIDFVAVGRYFAVAAGRLDFAAAEHAGGCAVRDEFDAELDAELFVRACGAAGLAAVGTAGLEIAFVAGLDSLEVSGIEL